MNILEDFLIDLNNRFKKLKEEIIQLLKEKKGLEEDFLIKEGFIIKGYSLNYSKINLFLLDRTIYELKKVVASETNLQEQLSEQAVLLNEIEEDYFAITKKKLCAGLLQKELEGMMHYSRLMIDRTEQMKRMLETGLRLHPKTLGKETEIFFASFEHIANIIIRFINFSEQLVKRILLFERGAYYPKPKTYGRAMSAVEFKETLSSKNLSSGKDPTPVFDAPVSVINKIASMSGDEIKNFFAIIGVTGASNIIFFQTRLKPINFNMPIRQSNGLREYKFPKGMNINILKAA